MAYKKILITSNRNTNYVRRGQTVQVDLTPKLQAVLDSGIIIDVTPIKPKPKPKADE